MVDIEVDINLLHERLSDLNVIDLRPLAGGASSLTYIATRGSGTGRPVVVKVAPAGLEPVRNRDVLRQARLMRALKPTAVPVPDVLWEDRGDPPDIPPLFVMSHVEGTSLEPLYDQGIEPADEMAGRLRDAAVVMAQLHALDPTTVGLGDEPPVSLDDEIARWSRALETIDEDLVPGWRDVADALAVAQPSPVPPRINHGDLRLGNMLANGSRIAAVIDWEIWSIGDPRVDLGWFLINADPATYERNTRYAGELDSPRQLVAQYHECIGHDVIGVEWFQALACFKSTATWALIVKHARRRAATDPATDDIARSLPHLLERARHHLS